MAIDLDGLSFAKKKLEDPALALFPLAAMDHAGGADELQAFFARHGYVFFRGLIPRSLVLDARLEILQKYAIIGEIDDRVPVQLGKSTPRTFRSAVNVRALRQSIVSGYCFQAVSRARQVREIASALLCHDATMLDYLWPRMAPPGSGTALHQDAPFLKGPPPEALVSVWTPLGDIDPSEGALVILAGSHHDARLRAKYGSKDADVDPHFGWYDTDLSRAQEQIGGIWLTADFKAGDVIFFDLMTLHGTFDNNSGENVRLSSDSRYQSSAFPIHPRWQGTAAPGRSRNRVFLPQATTFETLDNKGLSTEFHEVDELGMIVG